MRFDITIDTLKEIAGPNINRKIAAEMVQYLPDVMVEYRIHNKLRAAHFLAQLAHESDHFRAYQEYASGAEYEGRRDLGNIHKGDGVRYKGRGLIQITGRANYKRYGDILGIDLINHPELAAETKNSVRIAAEYWKDKGLNALADEDNIRQITRKINGGYNGLQNRIHLLNNAKRALDELIVNQRNERKAAKVASLENEPEVVVQPPVAPQQVAMLEEIPGHTDLDLEPVDVVPNVVENVAEVAPEVPVEDIQDVRLV